VAMVICGWSVMLVAWFVATRMFRGASDNRPRVGVPDLSRTPEAVATANYGAEEAMLK